jgi:hypothetical protein
MSKPDIAAMLNNVKMAISKHSPEILTGIGIAGMITTTILAVRATPKALEFIEDKKAELELEPDDKLRPVEVIEATWKCYVPAVVTGVMSTVCLIGASSVNLRRNAALMTAYNLSTTALSEYREQVIETVGEKKEQYIRNKVAEEHTQKNPANNSAIIVTDKGNTRFMDDVTKRRFTSDIETIKRIVNELNRRMLHRDDYVSLNDFYYEVGLEGCEVGDELGWNVSEGLIEIDFHAVVDTDGVPCIVLDYQIAPKRGFNRWN